MPFYGYLCFVSFTIAHELKSLLLWNNFNWKQCVENSWVNAILSQLLPLLTQLYTEAPFFVEFEHFINRAPSFHRILGGTSPINRTLIDKRQIAAGPFCIPTDCTQTVFTNWKETFDKDKEQVSISHILITVWARKTTEKVGVLYSSYLYLARN